MLTSLSKYLSTCHLLNCLDLLLFHSHIRQRPFFPFFPPPPPLPPLIRTHTNTHICRSRVKYVEVDPGSPNLHFSAGEDGYVRQYDERLPKSGCNVCKLEESKGSMYQSSNCLISANIHFMSLRLSPVDSNMLLAACGDQYVRLYDRRMLHLSSPSPQISKVVTRFCPRHLLNSSKARSTYAEFSSCGRSIVATYHADHTYTFGLDGDMDDSLGKPAVLQWRAPIVQLSTASPEMREAALKESIAAATSNIIAGTRLVDVDMTLLGYSMFSRAHEICIAALSRVSYFFYASIKTVVLLN